MFNGSFFQGLGVGLIVLSLAVYIPYRFVVLPAMDMRQSVDLSEEELIEKASKLGMIFVNDLPSDSSSASDLSNETIIERAHALGMVFQEVDAPTEPTLDENSDVIEILVPVGSAATEVCHILFENGLIDDELSFLHYLSSNDDTKRLKAGAFYIPLNADYEQISQILKRG